MDDTSQSSLAGHIQESPLLKRAFLRLEFASRGVANLNVAEHHRFAA